MVAVVNHACCIPSCLKRSTGAVMGSYQVTVALLDGSTRNWLVSTLDISKYWRGNLFKTINETLMQSNKAVGQTMLLQFMMEIKVPPPEGHPFSGRLSKSHQ